MAENVFREDGDFLGRVREAVVERDDLNLRLQTIREDLKKAKKQAADEEKSIRDETDSTIKKRRLELSSEYNRHINENQAKVKKAEAARDKGKSAQVNERIKEETKDLRHENRNKEKQIKKLFKENKVPLFCRTKFYYYMFMPKGLLDRLKMAGSFFLIYLCFPTVLTWLFRITAFSGMNEKKRDILSVIILAGVVIILILVYFFIYIKTKVKYLEEIKEGREIRDDIAYNDKKIKAIRKKILKDKDESFYELSDYDDRIRELTIEAENISDEKREALKNFDESVKNDIMNEINNRRKPVLDDILNNRDRLTEELSETEKAYKEKCLFISNNYASYIGEEFCTQDRLNDLIQIMADGAAETVSDAIAYYKNPAPKD